MRCLGHDCHQVLSLCAREIEGHSAKSLLEVQVLDVDFSRAVPLVLEELIDGFLDLVSEHAFGIIALLIICLAIVVNFGPHDVIPYEATLLVAGVQEGQIALIVEFEVVNHT